MNSNDPMILGGHFLMEEFSGPALIDTVDVNISQHQPLRKPILVENPESALWNLFSAECIT
jgi:hypothetical protein